jgi:hypothetical protein
MGEKSPRKRLTAVLYRLSSLYDAENCPDDITVQVSGFEPSEVWKDLDAKSWPGEGSCCLNGFFPVLYNESEGHREPPVVGAKVA